MAALLASITTITPSISTFTPPSTRNYRRFNPSFASLSSSSSPSPTESNISLNSSSFESPKLPEKSFSYPISNPSGSPVVRFIKSTESSIERVRVQNSRPAVFFTWSFTFFHVKHSFVPYSPRVKLWSSLIFLWKLNGQSWMDVLYSHRVYHILSENECVTL